MSTHTQRTIGDPKGITRREALIGAVTAIGSILAATAIGGVFVGTYKKVYEYIAKRKGILYANDQARPLRTSHSNPEIIALYEQYLSPGAVTPSRTELSHRLCHTVYGKNVEAHVAELKSRSLESVEQETHEYMETFKA